MSRYSSRYVNSILMFLSFGMICWLKLREVINEPEVGLARWAGGDGGIFTGTRFEMDSDFEVEGIEVLFWVEIERIILGALRLDFRKAVILLMFLNGWKDSCILKIFPLLNRPG